jgi:hypothetical protein
MDKAKLAADTDLFNRSTGSTGPASPSEESFSDQGEMEFAMKLEEFCEEVDPTPLSFVGDRIRFMICRCTTV